VKQRRYNFQKRCVVWVEPEQRPTTGRSLRNTLQWHQAEREALASLERMERRERGRPRPPRVRTIDDAA